MISNLLNLRELEFIEYAMALNFYAVIVDVFGGRNNKAVQQKYFNRVPGDSAQYYVPIAKIVKYSIDEIFEKKLYILIPFYIFTYEADFDEYNTDKEKLAELHGQYQLIIDRLSELVEKEEITAFDKKTIVDITDDVVRELTKKYTKLQKEVGDLMSGAMLETEARRLRDEYLQEGISQVAENMIRAQKPAEEIELMTGFSIDKLKELATKIGVMLVLQVILLYP